VNILDDPDASCLVVVNEEGQHALWPALLDAPAGWRVSYGPAIRPACLDYVNTHWVDMRPRSLVRHLDGPDLAR
jgi:MbtH protein